MVQSSAMCGCYALFSPIDDLQCHVGFGERLSLAPSYNVAPTQAAPVVRRRPEGAGRERARLRWGVVPASSKGPASADRLRNARPETAATSWGPPRRWPAVLLVPAAGFHERRRQVVGRASAAHPQPVPRR